jgi:NADH-quinone oxidoreductase subunit E
MALEFSTESEARIKHVLSEYYDKQAALLPVLYVAQDQFGHINAEICQLVAQRLELDRMHVESVASFYTMYYKQPIGRHHIQVCRTLSCAMAGSGRLVDYLSTKLGIKPGEVTPDGKFSLEAVECLAMCGSAPVMIINKTNHENLTNEKVDEILASLK